VRRFILQEYIPTSWFHPKGVLKVLERYKDRLPDVNRCLFVTFTLDRQFFMDQEMGPGEAFDCSRHKIRKLFYKLRQGVDWEGKTYKIDVPYCTKVEFHQDEERWPHFHVVWLTRKFIPAELISSIWKLGRTNVRRITNKKFNYILKYVCKSGQAPSWVKKRKIIRIFQTSRNFLIGKPVRKPRSKPSGKTRKIVSTIGERLDEAAATGLLIQHGYDRKLRYRQVALRDKFSNLFNHLVYAIARDGCYLGDGKIKIIEEKELLLWIKINKIT
jgi:hypothetical protein